MCYAKQVEKALIEAVKKQKNFHDSARNFEYLSDEFIKDKTRRKEFLEKLKNIFSKDDVTKKDNWYVKFVPLNEYTYVNLINKTIRFSSIYDFNDFNEENIFLPDGRDWSHYWKDNKELKKFKDEILKFLDERENMSKLIDAVSQSASYSESYKEEFKEKINPESEKDLEKIIEKYDPNIIETIAYLKTGIFCLSDIEVFKDDCAQLMFAHYAGNLKGLALIYEKKGSSIDSVEYKHSRVGGSVNKDVLLKLIQGKKTKNFLYKSPNWEYEKEYRVFSEHGIGIQKAEDYDLSLKGILYTNRQSSEEVKDSLDSINQKFYKDKLFVNTLYRNFDIPRKFVVSVKDSSQSAMEYLRNKQKEN